MEQRELEQLIGMYGRDIYSFCCYLTRNKQEADDLYQDTFVKAFEMQAFPEDKEGAKNLLLSVALRFWKEQKRKAARRRRIEEEQYIPQELKNAEISESLDTPEEHMIRNERNAYVRSCVEKLPEKMKVIVLLYYMEQRKMEEIVELTGVPMGTVKSRLHRAKKILAKELKQNRDVEVYVNGSFG